MTNQNYNATLLVSQSANKAFRCINEVTEWWTENLEGSTEYLNDVFTIRFGDDDFVTFRLIDVVPDSRMEWLVTDCYLPWFNDKTEWTNTKMSFEISAEDDKTKIIFTHIGLVPEVECYDNCVKGWDQYIKGSLYKLITEGKGDPQKKRS